MNFGQALRVGCCLLFSISIGCSSSEYPPVAAARCASPKTSDAPEIASENKTVEEPEEVLLQFVGSLIRGERENLEKLAVPHPDLEILLRDARYKNNDTLRAINNLKSSSFKRLQPGDRFSLGGGKTRTVGEAEISPNRTMIEVPGFFLPFVALRQGDRWKISPKPLIAVSKREIAVDFPKEMLDGHAPADLPEWQTPDAAPGELSGEIVFAGYSLRLPKDCREYSKADTETQSRRTWIWPVRSDKSIPKLDAVVTRHQPWLMDHKLDRSYRANLRLLKEKLQIVERGLPVVARIGDMPCIRVEYAGTASYNGAKPVSTQGFLLILFDRNHEILLNFIESSQAQPTLKSSLETAVHTLKRAE
jgi:hypothetical protein